MSISVARLLALLLPVAVVACGDDSGGSSSGGGDEPASTTSAGATSSSATSATQAQGSGGEAAGPGGVGGGGGGGAEPTMSSSTSATSTGGSGTGGESDTSSGAGGAPTGSGGGTGAPRQNLIIETTAEGADWADGWDIDNQTPDTGYALAQSSERARFGASAIRFELHDDDPIVSSSVRTEMQPLDDQSSEEMERWYGLSYFLADWGADTGGESILQWHDVNGTCPPLSIQIYGNEMSLTNCIDFGSTYFSIGDVTPDTWMDIVIHVVWRTDQTGVLELWRDGEKVVDAHDLQTQSTGGSYLKVGMNKWSWAPGGGESNQSQRVFFIDELRIGNDSATLYDVAPGAY